jgi:hypothetical protein
MRAIIVGPGLLVAAVMGGCFTDDSREEAATPETPDESSAAAIVSVPCPDVSGTDVSRSLAVTDQTALARFSFARVMNQIRTTANVTTAEGSLPIYQRWMRTFGSTAAPGDCNDPNIDPNDYGLACPRPNELALASINPFPTTAAVRFVPVALFNRFDLAPANGASCGEYRIVYAMSSTSPTVGGRAFIIFEASLPNPNPTAGIDGCLGVARFWQGLSTDNDVLRRAAKLDRFYFGGTAVAGVAPVVRAAHYGLSTNAAAATAGQVRTNFFVSSPGGGFQEWHLREFKLKRTCTNVADPATCNLSFAHVPVKANPAEELFAGTHTRSAAFRSAFVNQVPGLAATDVNLIRMRTNDVFNEFESSAQNGNVNYRLRANGAMVSAVDAKLDTMSTALVPGQIFDRATTQTCGGCHQLSNGANLGGVTWPSSLGFVHVDETSQLSPALRTTFLPHRKRVLERFINARCSQDGGAPPITDASPPPPNDGGPPITEAGPPPPRDGGAPPPPPPADGGGFAEAAAPPAAAEAEQSTVGGGVVGAAN